jgi:uncharacterized protein (TIGR02147 family)
VAQSEPNIFDYFDYSQYLREYYEYARINNPGFSYRYIQQKTGVDPGYMFKVFQGKKNLSQDAALEFIKMLKLTKVKAEYFKSMVLFAKAKNNQDAQAYFEKLLTFSKLSFRKVDKDAYEYYQKWYYAAIRQILSYYPFIDDYKELAKMTVPAITEAEAKSSVQLLLSLGFIEKSPTKKGYELTSKFLTTGEEWRSIAIRKFQQDTILLAHKALDQIPKEERDISTVSLTMSEDGLKKAKEIIAAFRSQLLELANQEENANRAYHVNIQLIPIGVEWKST